ncbi:MAG: 2-hydroxyglutaryl-CoA dehydratase, partial [Firmicutes bacterium]|nr:2-hydroxyglutaryl-CoA dehydratase [Bacillota bacterium]
MIVGIPQTLSFYSYYPLWKTFLEDLGAEVLLSRPTNREILEWGIRDTVTDACIPIKIFQGHVIDLKDRVDYLFIPRMVSVDGRATFCPKFLGLPDMVRFSGTDLPPVIDSRVKATRFRSRILTFLRDVARQLKVTSKSNLLAACYRACRKQRTYEQLLLSGLLPLDAMQRLERKPALGNDAFAAEMKPGNNTSEKLKIALLGYPYVLYDP